MVLGAGGWGSGLGRKNLRLPSRSDDVSARSVGALLSKDFPSEKFRGGKKWPSLSPLRLGAAGKSIASAQRLGHI